MLEDRRYRFLAWGTLGAVIAGWTAYYLGVDSKPFRIAMEALSTVALVAAVLRIRWLLRAKQLHSPVLSGMARFPRQAWRAVGSPWLIVAKVWLVAMIVMEWRGKADFSALEYSVVSGLLVATIVVQYLITRRARPRFAGLEALAQGAAPAAACPFGFGCDAAPAPLATQHGTDAHSDFPAEVFAGSSLKNVREA